MNQFSRLCDPRLKGGSDGGFLQVQCHVVGACVWRGSVPGLVSTLSILTEPKQKHIFFHQMFSKVNELQAFTQNIINIEREAEFIVSKCYISVYRNFDL